MPERGDGPGYGGRGETREVREPLAEPEEPFGSGVATELLPAVGGPGDPAERGGVPEHGRRGDRPTDDSDEQRGPERSMNDPTERRETGPGPDLEAATEDRGHAPEAAPAEEVREMRDLDRGRSGTAGESAHGEGDRERAGGAHPESLSDGELVREAHGQRSRLLGGHPTRHVLGDGPRPSPVAEHADPGAPTRGEPGLGPRPELEDDPRPHRPATARVAGRRIGSEDPRDVAGSERTDRTDARDHHRPRPGVLATRSYKQTRIY